MEIYLKINRKVPCFHELVMIDKLITSAEEVGIPINPLQLIRPNKSHQLPHMKIQTCNE